MRSISLFLAAALLAPDAQGQATRPDAPVTSKAMSFDLAFTQRELYYGQRVAIAPDGGLVAYTAHETPAKSVSAVNILPSGTPGDIPNSWVVVTDGTPTENRRIPPESGNCWRPSFSPDGTRLAMYCDTAGKVNVWIYDVRRKTSRRLSDAPIKPKFWTGDEPDWSPDGKEIFVPLAPPGSTQLPAAAAVETGMDEPGMEVSKEGPTVTIHRAGGELRVARGKEQGGALAESSALQMRVNNAALGAIDLSTGRVRTVAPPESNPPPSVLQVSPSGKWVAYLSVFRQPTTIQSNQVQDLAVVPARGGAVQVVAAAIPVSSDYLLGAYAWHPSRDQIFWVKEDRLWTADLTTGSVQARRLAETLNDVTPGLMAVTRDGKSVVVGVKPFDHPTYQDPHPQALAVVPLDGGAPNLLPIPTGLEFQGVVRQRGWTLWQPKPDAITALCREVKTGNAVVLRLDLASGKSTSLWQGLARLRVAGAAADHGPPVVTFEDMNTPEDVYRFSLDFTSKTRVSQVEPRLAGIRFGPVETFETPVRRHDDSLAQAVTSAVLLPAGAKRGDRLPAIVFVYPRHNYITSAAEFGGGSPATVPAALFTTRGYAVVLTDAPVRPTGQAGNFIADLADVIVPQVQHAADLGYVDIARVAVSGQSFGGYSTAALLSATNLFCAGIANAGSYDLLYHYFHMGRTGGYGYPPGVIENYWNMRSQPFEDLPRWQDASPFFRAERIRAPILLVHGMADVTCPIEDVRKMFNALRSLGRTVQFAEYAGEGHVLSSWAPVNAADAARRMLEFLDKYLRPAAVDSARRSALKTN